MGTWVCDQVFCTNFYAICPHFNSDLEDYGAFHFMHIYFCQVYVRKGIDYADRVKTCNFMLPQQKFLLASTQQTQYGNCATAHAMTIHAGKLWKNSKSFVESDFLFLMFFFSQKFKKSTIVLQHIPHFVVSDVWLHI